ncbi:replication protein [Pandoraea pnomenusa]|uniref:replication protein n=1 Tax=Pandoraea pnomenusa TaxID=93220 RepID=UPI0011476778|nr:replication protein [Pandoraea pnomenusa]QDH59467.1 replication protein [Pandoraea pnomenusa]
MAQPAQVIPFPEVRVPQLEHGYTRVANELLEAITMAPFGRNQYKVLMVLIRKTYGFNKTSDQLALSQIQVRAGISKTQTSVAVAELVKLNVLTAGEGRYAREFSINKAYGKWDASVRVDLSVLSSENRNSEVPESGTHGSENRNSGVPESGTTKDTSKRQDQKTTPKDILSRSLRERFEIFWAGYPKRKSKKTAEKAFAKLNPDEQLFTDLMAGLGRAKTSVQWANPQYIPHAASWLNAGGWMDEIQSTYADAELAVIQGFNEVLGEHVGKVDETVFVEERAGAIRAFMAYGTEKRQNPEMWRDYFPWVKANVEVPPNAGFDWLISPKGFSNVIGGQHNKADKR